MKQIFPPSITGKGSMGTSAEHASVLEHKFGQGDPYTLGVEEEYMLLDPETWDLVQHIDSVLAAVESGGEHEGRLHAELMQSVLEVTTPVCRTASDVMRALAQLRGYVADIARAEGCRFGSAGTHPFSLFERQRITARDRYRNLVDQLQYIARRELIFGMHMHVAVDDPEKAIQVMNGLLVYLPQMLALSASSPFWRGEPTGLSSSRQMVFAAFPRSGPPPRFRDYTDYAEVVGQLERTGCIADYTHIWWDIRPHPRLGTIEMRVCDAVTRLEDVVAITAFFQAIVKLQCELFEAGREIPTWHRLLTTENKWLAARYGLEAPIMDLATGRRNRVPIAQLVRRTLRDVEPHAKELGSERELEGIREILARGNGADRQLRVWNANRDIVEVVREISVATEEAVVSAAPEAVP
ncbi:MAG: carboxylate-amine ligase [Gaiellaceae bacterium]